MPSPTDITAKMIQALAISEPELDTSIGTPIRKILDVVAEGISEVNLDRYMLNYVYDIDSRSGADLDAFVSLFGFSRISAKVASGTLLLQRSTPAPASVLVPAGSQASSNDTTPVIVRTSQPITFPRGAVSIEVPVVAVAGGSVGNLVAGAIIRWLTAVEGIVSVINPAALTGGADSESDEQLRTRFKRTFLRNLAGTESMFLAVAVDNDHVVNADVYGPYTSWKERIEVVSGSATSGIWPLDSPFTVIAATNASPSVITVLGTHGFVVDDIVSISGSVGNTAINGFWRVNSVPTTATFTVKSFLGVAVNGNGVWTSGGTVYRVGRVGVTTSPFFGSNIDLGQVSAPWYYTFTGGSTAIPPTVTAVQSGDGVYDLAYQYQSQASRNNASAEIGSMNKVDIWVDGSNAATANDVVMVDGATVFNATATSPSYFGRFRRDDGSYPASTSLKVDLSFTPFLSIPSTLVLGATTLTSGVHYFPVRDRRASQVGSAMTVESLEFLATSFTAGNFAIVSSTNATPIVVTVGAGHFFVTGQTVVVAGHVTNTAANGTWTISVAGNLITLVGSVGNGIGGATGTVTLRTPLALTYTYNEVPRLIQRDVESRRLLTTDVLVHKANPVPLRIYLAAILRPGFSVTGLQASINSVVTTYLTSLGIGGILQLSDLLNIVGDITGIDAVRMLTSNDMTPFTITAATNATPIVLTTSATHSFVAGDLIVVDQVAGNTNANGVWKVGTVGGTTITLVDSAGNAAYTSGGRAIPAKFAIQTYEPNGTTLKALRIDRTSVPYRAIDTFIDDNEHFTLSSVVVTSKAQNTFRN